MNFEISGMLLRNGRTFAPAGMMSSVETLSLALRRTGRERFDLYSRQAGQGLMLGPRKISTLLASLSGSGGITMARFVAQFKTIGLDNRGSFPSSIEILTPVLYAGSS